VCALPKLSIHRYSLRRTPPVKSLQISPLHLNVAHATTIICRAISIYHVCVCVCVCVAISQSAINILCQAILLADILIQRSHHRLPLTLNQLAHTHTHTRSTSSQTFIASDLTFKANHGMKNTSNKLSNSSVKLTVKCAVMNCRSMKNKALAIADFICDNKIMLLCLTETWLQNDPVLDHFILNEACPTEFLFLHNPRTSKRGGGVALIYKRTLNVSALLLPPNSYDFEFLATRVALSSRTFVMVIIYRPPSGSIANFLSQLADLFSHILSHYDEVIFTGDFNLRLLSESRVLEQLNDLLTSFSLCQHINSPTHERGDILDLVITRTSSTFLSNISIMPGLADHFSIVFDLSSANSDSSVIHTFTRRFNDSNIQQIQLEMVTLNEVFLHYVTNTPSLLSPDSIDTMVEHFYSSLTQVLDVICPLVPCRKRSLIYHGLTPPSGEENVTCDSSKDVGDVTSQ
jgi:hypothetical protein